MGTLTDHATTGPVQAPSIDLGLLGRVVVPVVLAMEQLREGERNLCLQNARAVLARLKDQHALLWVLAQAAGQDAACRASSNNDIVVALGLLIRRGGVRRRVCVGLGSSEHADLCWSGRWCSEPDLFLLSCPT